MKKYDLPGSGLDPDLSNAMHFIIRHWHTDKDSDAITLNPDQNANDTNYTPL